MPKLPPPPPSPTAARSLAARGPWTRIAARGSGAARGSRPAARGSRLAARGRWIAALGAVLVGCAVHRGEWAPEDPGASTATRERPALRLLLIGDAGHRGRHGSEVAAAIDGRLEAGRAEGVATTLLWLGDNLAPARCDGAIDPRIAPLTEVAAAHVRAGGASYAAIGEAEWACAGRSASSVAAQRQPAGAPWSAPAENYVIRVDVDGRARVASRCEGTPLACTIEASGDASLIDLVILDSAAWLAPPPPGSALAAEAARSLAEQAALIAALRAAPGPERILVSHHPIESAGPHGVGGRWPDSAYAFHSEPVRAAVHDGVFVGVLAAHEHAVQMSADLSPAIKRSSRAWITAPIFELEGGASTRPDAWIGARSWRYFQGVSLAPAAISNHAGFAELNVAGDALELVLWARRAGRWRRAALTVPRRRPPHPVESASPGMEPCLQCDTTAPRQ
ncbi:MAG: hypothetical protein R3B09_27130 [Nannocystaceae bacterium]